MSFNKKTWVDREAQYPVRRQLTKLSEGTDGQGRNVMTVDVTRAEGTITSQGDAFSAANMNDLENRIDAATVIDSSLSSTSQNALQNKEVNAAIVAALSKLAPTDLNGATAGSAHASGQYIIYGTPAAPKFGKTKAAISVGDTFNSGTGGNITDEDIATELTALNSALNNIGSIITGSYRGTGTTVSVNIKGHVATITLTKGTWIIFWCYRSDNPSGVLLYIGDTVIGASPKVDAGRNGATGIYYKTVTTTTDVLLSIYNDGPQVITTFFGNIFAVRIK